MKDSLRGSLRTGLIDVVLHAEVSSDAVDEHPVIGRHGGKAVARSFRIPRQRRHFLLDPQQRGSILVVAVQRLDDKVSQVDARVVRVRVRSTDATVDRGATGVRIRRPHALAALCVHLFKRRKHQRLCSQDS